MLHACVLNERPPLPKYASTWEVSTVLTYLSQLGHNKNLTSVLTKKLTMLLALVLAHRSSDLKRLTLQGRKYTANGVYLMPMALGKQFQPGSQQGMQPIFIAAFTEDLSLCPLLCLQQYEETTKELRPEDGSQQLLIATVAPHKPVASSTIARWLKEVLNASGVDVSIFQAHSTRGASTSAAAMAGVTTIMEQAGWSQQSTFCRYYCCN